jgi:hypothetical protein
MKQSTDQLILLDDRIEYSAPVLAGTPELDWHRRMWSPNMRDPMETFDQFLKQAPQWFASTKLNTITGLDAFPEHDIIMGCNHFIDNLLMKRAYQTFEYDYTYYKRLHPHLRNCTIETLIPRCPLIISMPFAGQMNIHADMTEILDKCAEQEIPVHIDAAWLSASRGIEFNFDHPAIQSVAMSMSKGLNLWWNRVGIRWTRTRTESDSISIYNRFRMIPLYTVDVGLHYIQSFPPDYLWNYYNDKYNEICKRYYLRPTVMVHVAQSLDRSETYGLKKLLEQI